MVEKRSFILLMAVIAVLFVGTLACSQSGNIITSAEATEKAKPTTIPTAEAKEGVQVGDEVYLVGRNFLISLMDGPGSRRMIAGQERGAKVVILQTADVDGVYWYFVDAPTGEGWVPEENISAEAP